MVDNLLAFRGIVQFYEHGNFKAWRIDVEAFSLAKYEDNRLLIEINFGNLVFQRKNLPVLHLLYHGLGEIEYFIGKK